MADGRFISRGISTSQQLAGVSLKAAFLFTWCLPHQDVEGRMPGNPRTVKAIACPLRDELSVKTVGDCLGELANAKLILWYSTDGVDVVSFPNFRRHQKGLKTDREAPSRLPPRSDSSQDLLGTRSGLCPPKLSKGKLREEKLSGGKGIEAKAPPLPDSLQTAVVVDLPDDYKPHLARMLETVAEPMVWLIEMRAMLDGMPGHHYATPEQLGQAIRDYLANGAAQNKSLRQFRRYVEGILAESKSSLSGKSPMERSMANTAEMFRRMEEA